MKTLAKIWQVIKRYSEVARDIAIAIDTTPEEVLYAEIVAIKREVVELKQQRPLHTARTRKAA